MLRFQFTGNLVGLVEAEAGVDGAVTNLHGERLEGGQRLQVWEIWL